MTVSLSREWFSRLKPNPDNKYGKALLEVYTPEALDGKFVVAVVIPEGVEISRDNGTPSTYSSERHYYRVFDNYSYFFQYLNKVPVNMRWYHEVIFGDVAQKPRFDIDISYKTLIELTGITDVNKLDAICEDLFVKLINATISTMKSQGVMVDPAEDFIIYDSSGPTLAVTDDIEEAKRTGNYKFSRHPIIHTFFHSNSKEANFFCDSVIGTLLANNPELKTYVNANFIDLGIYKSLQNFRVPGGCKPLFKETSFGRVVCGSRMKNLVTEWYLTDVSGKYLTDCSGKCIPMEGDRELTEERKEIARSAHTEITCRAPVEFSELDTPDERYAKRLHLFSKGVIGNIHGCKYLSSFTPPEVPRNLSGSEEVTEELAEQALALCAATFGIHIDDLMETYEIEEIRGCFVCLKRLQSSLCRLCSRIHDAENPYLFIAGDCQTVLFNCRRSRSFLRVGDLKVKNIDSETVDAVPAIPTYVWGGGGSLEGLLSLLPPPKSSNLSREIESPDTSPQSVSPTTEEVIEIEGELNLISSGVGLLSRKNKTFTKGVPVMPKNLNFEVRRDEKFIQAFISD